MKVTERYATAIRSSCLTVDERTTYSDTDVLAGMGCADKALTTGKGFDGRDIPKTPLAVPLQRLFMGDNGAAKVIVGVLEDMAWKRARTMGVKLKLQQARELAQQCLQWHRDSACKVCGGHGTQVIPGTKTLGGSICKPCRGTGKAPFERQFRHEWRDLARWLLVQMERAQAKAGPEAMKWIAPKLDF